LQQAQELKKQRIDNVRNLRAKEKQEIALIRKLDEADQFAKTENNFLPLLALLAPELQSYFTTEELSMIPTKKSAAAKTPVVKK
jgi:hypothetical protein